MLVLSRRPNEKILFPGIDTSVQIVSIKGNVVRLGIEAPPQVTVLREELQEHSNGRPEPVSLLQTTDPGLRAIRHLLRNRLNGLTVGLELLRKQATMGLTDDVQHTISLVKDEVGMLRQRIDSETAEPTNPPPKPVTKAPKALLVEDDQNERELLAGFLRLSGFAVDTAGDGCDALDHLRNGGRPDVILLDMGLPRCDGPTMTKQLRRDPAYASVRIFAVSGHSPEEYDLARGPAGVDRWFSKPLDPLLLLNELTTEFAPGSKR